MATIGRIKKEKMEAAKDARLQRGKKKMEAKAERQAGGKRRWF